MPVFPSVAYTQTVVRLYPNGRVPIPKRLLDYTQFETHSKPITIQLSIHSNIGCQICLFAFGQNRRLKTN